MTSKMMMGRVAAKPIYCDLDAFCASNGLVTGMTRSGKSYKLRTMAETLCSHIPVFVIDPEGEFYTLRERFPFLLFGDGGEAPIAVNTARATARHLLKWQKSAVLSLASLREAEQHLWVADFLNELMNRPRPEWTRAVVMLDEAHLWAPNLGHGKTSALAEARNLARRGLKRGLIPVWATQRLSSLNVSVSSSAENMLVGRTTRTADQEQAAKLLGVAPRLTAEFCGKMRRCKRGDFFAVGPAYSEDIVVLETPTARTTHFSGKVGQEPKVRPTPVKLRYLIPEIEAMVAEAEREAVEAESDKQKIQRLEKALKDGGIVLHDMTPELEQQLTAAKEVAEAAREKVEGDMAQVKEKLSELMHNTKALHDQVLNIRAFVGGESRMEDSTTGELTQREEAVLKGMREAETTGETEIRRPWAIIMSGQKYSGLMNDTLAALQARKLLSKPRVGYLSLSPEGRMAVPAPSKKLHRDTLMMRMERALGEDGYPILQVLVEMRALWTPRKELATRANYSHGSSKFPMLLARMKRMDLLELGPSGTVRIHQGLMQFIAGCEG